MSVILVSDVFGITPAFVEVAKALKADIMVDPYGGEDLGFENEADAYSHFMEHVGIEAYHLKLLELASSASLSSTLIGFSVGATVVWRLSGNAAVNNICRAFCYYGSQIRKHSAVDPLYEITLIFPASEPHFNVVELQDKLLVKRNVKIQKTNMMHGFMNERSRHFNRVAYEEQLKWLRLNLS